MTNKITSELWHYKVNRTEVDHLYAAAYKYYILRYLTVAIDGYREYVDAQEFWRSDDK